MSVSRRSRHVSALDAAALVALVAVVGVFAVLRWTGHAPFGSDHDEYRMVAEAMRAGHGPVVAGIEGTKYPLGYSLVLAVAATAGLPMTTFALALNVALVAVTALLVWAAARPVGPATALIAGGFVAVGAGLWDGVYAVMPDVALTALVAASLWQVLRVERRVAGDRPGPTGPDPGYLPTWTGRDVAVLAALAAAATALKTVGVLLAAAMAVHLLTRPYARRFAWAPVVAAVGMAVAQAAVVAGYPEHTTGYGATFWLADPFDAAAGRLGPLDLPWRIAERLDLFLHDAGRAVLSPQTPRTVAIAGVLVLVASAVGAWRRSQVLLGAFALVYAVGLAAWPYRSIRFGMPLVPVAALGVAAVPAIVERYVAHRGYRRTALAVSSLLLVAFGVWSASQVADRAAAEEAELAELRPAVAEAVAWMDEHIPEGQPIASLDYREIAWRLGRPVLPVSYTSDPDELWAQTGGAGARWFVAIRGLYHARDARVRDLLEAFPDRFEEAFSNARVQVWRIRTDAD